MSASRGPRGAGANGIVPAVRTGLVALALAAVAAVASKGVTAWAEPRNAVPQRLELLVTVALIVALLACAVLVVLLIVHRTVLAGPGGAPPLRGLLLRVLPAASAAIVVVALLAIPRVGLERGSAGAPGARLVELVGGPGTGGAILDDRDPGARPGEPPAEEVGSVADPGAGAPMLAIGLAALVATVAAVLARAWAQRTRRRRDTGDEAAADGAAGDAVRGAVVDSIDAMMADPDPRTAIIGAYARLLEGLAARGIARHAHEGPMEHIRRVLAVVHVRPAPMHRLLELFTAARFSDHRLGATHREAAIGALRTIAAELGGEHRSGGEAGTAIGPGSAVPSS